MYIWTMCIENSTDKYTSFLQCTARFVYIWTMCIEKSTDKYTSFLQCTAWCVYIWTMCIEKITDKYASVQCTARFENNLVVIMFFTIKVCTVWIQQQCEQL